MPQIIFMYMTFVFYIKKQLVCIKLFCSKWDANEAEKNHGRVTALSQTGGLAPLLAMRSSLSACSDHQIRLGGHNSLSQKV